MVFVSLSFVIACSNFMLFTVHFDGYTSEFQNNVTDALTPRTVF